VRLNAEDQNFCLFRLLSQSEMCLFRLLRPNNTIAKLCTNARLCVCRHYTIFATSKAKTCRSRPVEFGARRLQSANIIFRVWLLQLLLSRGRHCIFMRAEIAWFYENGTAFCSARVVWLNEQVKLLAVAAVGTFRRA
jgi:hypothetical protein